MHGVVFVSALSEYSIVCVGVLCVGLGHVWVDYTHKTAIMTSLNGTWWGKECTSS